MLADDPPASSKGAGKGRPFGVGQIQMNLIED